MDAPDPEDTGLNTQHFDEESGSAYEESSSNADLNSPDERPTGSQPSSQQHRGRGRSVKAGNRTRDGDEEDPSLGPSTSPQAAKEVHLNATEWAAKFQAPESPGDIRSPTRHIAGTQSKRKSEKPPSEIRTKRLKAFYSNDYRELLNVEIHEAAARVDPHEYASLPKSQIGSSIWTGPEKEMFFSALSKLGRHDVRAIAGQVRSKSELEVQEYIQTLCEGTKRKENEQQHLDLTDHSAAVEISDECCGLLERAGDALASRQERSEERKERAKWGDFWLLTTEVSKSIEKQRREGGGEENIEERLPAANLFNLKNWLELSQKMFMNPAESRGGEGWQAFAEPGETPAIRATAFDDLYSLTVSITKRIISTTLFCAMARRRATNSTRAKGAEVSRDDVEAAIRILNLREDSHEFWVGSARRLYLKVFDNDENPGKRTNLTYDEVEAALRQEIRRRSRSRSRSRSFALPEQPARPTSSVGTRSDRDDLTKSSSESLEAGHESLQGQESDDLGNSSFEDEQSTDLSDAKGMPHSSRQAQRRERKNEEEREMGRAEEAYIAAFDDAANQMEEERLWALLGQTAPFEIKSEPLPFPDRPKNNKTEVAEADWRDNIEYWSPWETMETPVPEESFMRNGKRKRNRSAGRGGRKTRTNSSAAASSDLEDEDEEMEHLSVETGSMVYSSIEEEEEPPYNGKGAGSSEEDEEVGNALVEDDDNEDDDNVLNVSS